MYLTSELTEALDSLGLEYRVLDEEESKEYKHSIYNAYSNGLYQYPLWDNLKKGLKDLGKGLTSLEGQVYVFFDEDKDKGVVVIEEGHKLVQALNLSFLFSYYVSDKDLSYLMFENDHSIEKTLCIYP